MTAKNRWDERRAYDEAHAKQVSNAKDYTRLEEKAEKLNWTFNALDKIEEYLETKGLVDDYKEWRNANSKKV